METVTRLAERHPSSVSMVSTPSPEVARTLSVTAVYLLSEDGRKASLLAGGDGRAIQQIAIQVPAHRLHLVSVDRQGVARLKLRPRFETEEERGVVRIDAAPIYDAPPSVEELYRAAAKNHELESAYYAQRTAERAKRRDSDRDLRERVAEAFLADKGQRAIAHPPPTPKRCCVITERGRFFFDIATDHGLAKDVPAEAHRRFRADVRNKHERDRQDRTAQLALHEEKKRFIADWVARHGTDEQRTRQADGVLPMDEAIEAITDQVFSPLREHVQYARDGLQQMRAQLARLGRADEPVAPGDLVVKSEHAKMASAEQWMVVKAFRALMPEATVCLRVHRIALKGDSAPPPVVEHGILVSMKHGPFTLRREYGLTVAPAESVGAIA
jgi:hypothetical protein